MRCEKHSKPQVQLPATGTCQECGSGTNTRSKKLCSTCSNRLGQCEVCRAPAQPSSSGE